MHCSYTNVSATFSDNVIDFQGDDSSNVIPAELMLGGQPV